MNSMNIKLTASAVIVILILTAVPMIGLTVASADNTQGLMIDFGYWDVVWTEMTFTEDMDGYDVLETACHINGYDCTILDDGTVYSINGQVNLVGIQWGLYALSNGNWASADPSLLKASDHTILCWSRSTGADTVMPGADATGYTYYDYAEDGESTATKSTLKVVSLAPSITETLCSVKGIDYIVGTDLYSNYPEEVVEGQENGTISIIGGYTDPNYEWIIALNPDIVFCDGGTGEHVTIADKLRKSGINCVVLYDGTDIATLYNNIWITASALGLSENANAEISNLRSTIDVVSGIAGITGLRVFSALSADPSPWTCGSDTFMSDVISTAGGVNIFDSQSSSWFMVSKEQIYAKQPNVIIIISSTEVTTDEEYQAVLDSLDPVWKATPAYLDGEVYIFSGAAGDILSRPGPRLSEAVELISKILNPEAFQLLDALDAIPKYFGDDYQQYLTYQSEAYS